MNPLYDQMFNPQYVNHDYLYQFRQREQYAWEQRQEITKAVKALHDYCTVVRKIAPEYQQEAFYACAAAVLEEINANSPT